MVRKVWMMCTREGNGTPAPSVLAQAPGFLNPQKMLKDEGWAGKGPRQGPEHRPPSCAGLSQFGVYKDRKYFFFLTF